MIRDIRLNGKRGVTMQQTYIITGATSGLGLTLVKQLLHDGHKVIALVRNIEKMRGLNLELQDDQLQIVPCDMLDPDSIKAVASHLNHTSLDGFIYCSGVGYFKGIEAHTTEEMLETYQVNVVHFNLLFQTLQPFLKNNASIVGIGSQAGFATQAYAAHYGASKIAFYQLMNALRLEYPNYHVMTVNTGPIRTPFHQKADPSGRYQEQFHKLMIEPEILTQEIIIGMHLRKNEINRPRWMRLLLKLYNLAPRFIEKIASPLFKNKGSKTEI